MPSTGIQTYTGIVFDPLNPDPARITIQDVAHSLALQCRFTGATRQFYSVAEHSVRVSYEVPEEDALEGLMHDASEFALTDVAAPLKDGVFGDLYRQAEDRLQAAIAERFGLRYPLPQSVKDADRTLLATEFRDLLNEGDPAEHEYWAPWISDLTPLRLNIIPWRWQRAKAEFLRRFYQLAPHERR